MSDTGSTHGMTLRATRSRTDRSPSVRSTTSRSTRATPNRPGNTTIGQKHTAAYGTRGKPLSAYQKITTEQALTDAINPIVTAVAKASAENAKNQANEDLSIVREETDNDDEELPSTSRTSGDVGYSQGFAQGRQVSESSHQSHPETGTTFNTEGGWALDATYNVTQAQASSHQPTEDASSSSSQLPADPAEEDSSSHDSSLSGPTIFPQPDPQMRQPAWMRHFRTGDKTNVLLGVIIVALFAFLSRDLFMPFLPSVPPGVKGFFNGCSASSDAAGLALNATKRIPAQLKQINSRIDFLENQLHDLRPCCGDEKQATHQIDYLAEGSSSAIDYFLTSPRKQWLVQTHKTFTRSFLNPSRWFNGEKYQVLVDASLPASQVLGPWHDVLDRWCAPATRGKLQLTVIMAWNITPTELVVESFPPEGLFWRGALPKDIELWIQIYDDKLRRNVGMDFENRYGPIADGGATPRGLSLAKEKSLPPTFVPVGRWMYDIHKPSNIQKFSITPTLGTLRVFTQKVAIRVNSNWGDRDASCLYRVRLHGKEKPGRKSFENI